MTSSDQPVNLRKVLDSNFLAHRKDIHDYAGGHLNPNKLLKPEPTDSQVTWQSASSNKKENPCGLIAQTRKNADKRLADTIEQMQNTLVDFSIGTSGTLSELRPPGRTGKRSSLPKKSSVDFNGLTDAKTSHQQSEIDLESKVLSGITRLLDNQNGPEPQSKSSSRVQFKSHLAPPSAKRLPVGNYRFHKVLTEEVKLPELLLPSVQENLRVPESMKDPHSTPKQRVNLITNKNFTTMHLAGVTQKDRFSKMRDFDRNVLHRYETMEKRVRDGHKAAEHLEHKLIVRLLELKEHNHQPYSVNFERLQVYDEVWRDICIDSSIFGKLLLEIKLQYDTRLSTLLDTINSTNHSEIMTCLKAVECLTEYTENDVVKKKMVVDDLEEEGRQALLRNYELHQQIEKERVLTEERRQQKEKEEKENRLLLPLKYFAKKRTNDKEQPAKKEANNKKRLHILRVKIWEKLDEIAETRNDLRENYVPKTLHKNMQQAVQDTESEMQKLLQQKEYITKSIAIHVETLRYDFSRFDTMNADESQSFLSTLGTS